MLQGIEVMVIDDEEWNVSNLIKQLRRNGAHVVYENTVEGAIDYLVAEDTIFDYIISDLNMGEFSGSTALNFLSGYLHAACEEEPYDAPHPNTAIEDTVHSSYGLRFAEFLSDLGIVTFADYTAFLENLDHPELILYCGHTDERTVGLIPKEIPVFKKNLGTHTSDEEVLEHIFAENRQSRELDGDIQVLQEQRFLTLESAMSEIHPSDHDRYEDTNADWFYD
jgi:hypothetical protein